MLMSVEEERSPRDPNDSRPNWPQGGRTSVLERLLKWYFGMGLGAPSVNFKKL
jgi:hypothetical protein